MTGGSTAGERRRELLDLGARAATCTACRLAESRTQVVFGSGDPEADLMVVGEGPGQREDEQGLPFVGPSGRLLDQLFGEIGLTRDEVYIANVVKCRPPGNRDPKPDEIDACKGYLRSQLSLVDPKVVVTLGNFSSKLLLRTEAGITRLRGHRYEWWGRYLVPTFHPAAALRGSQQVLDHMRHDFGIVRAIIDNNPEDTSAEVTTRPDGAPRELEDPKQLGLFG